MIGGEADAPLDGRGEHRGAEPLGERHGVVETAGGVDVAADDERRGAGGVEGLDEDVESRRVRGRALVHPAARDEAGRLGGRVEHDVPVVHRDRHEHRAPRRAGRDVDRAGQHGRDVGRAGRLEGELDRGARQHRRVRVREQGLEVHHRPHLLPGRDHQRRTVGGRVDQGADGVADAGRGVQVDQGRTPAGLGVPVGHADDRGLLQPEDVPEVVGELGEHGELGGPGVAEDRGHPVGPEHLQRGLPDRGSLRHASSRRSWPITAMIAVLRRRRQEYPSI